ncbi:helix-turn-helix domain-containing protein [Fulvivirga ligni]|uniref:helix-turn-helix domain-containing protein n=1 Tax=Fulvivirga ligni TaxID=2904246 RepID=UPI001F15C235|nr:helix-turn-helix transcriptional regulator [Fulvivirga ligni]UII19274.1 helix-turn-helix domain-containing protein [Fulvivirga ligni]
MSEIFDSIEVSDEVKRFVDHSFDISDQIYNILEKQGKTQRDLARMLGKKESEVSKWMQGTHNFTLKSIAKIEAVLGESIITCTDRAKKAYHKTKLVPVRVNNFSLSKKILTQEVEWKKSDKKVFTDGLKIA